MTVVNKVVLEEEQGARLDRWIKKHFPEVPKTLVFKLLRKKAITVNGKKVEADYTLKAWDVVKLPPSCTSNPAPKPLDPLRSVSEHVISDFVKSVIYQDKNLIAINKAPGLAVQGGPDIKISVDRLAFSLKGDHLHAPKLVHRLDRDTSGVLLLARTTESAQHLTSLFRSKKPITKTYYALVKGIPEEEEGWINLPLAQGTGSDREIMEVNKKDGQTAKTFYRIIEYIHGIAALVELVPYTGRKHQLRVHMACHWPSHSG
ncbi:MAG: RluA family pseudouridine synthase [Alphaproteobacteria bacterium]|nr:RluA family pseudouridine synthase [Alphaproteobacteria bacterium]